MKLQRSKTTVTSIVAAIFLLIGMSSTPAMADGYTNGKGKQSYYLHHGNRLTHHRGNRSPSHNNNYYKKRDRRDQARQRWHGNRHHSDRRYQELRRHNSNRRHNNLHRGRASHKSNNLLGAVVGGTIIYHLGQK